MKHLLLSLSLGAAAACRTTAGDDGRLLTDETRGALRKYCRDAFADGDWPDRLKGACTQLRQQHGQDALATAVERYCAEAPAYYARLLATAKAEATLVITGDDGAAPGAEDRACADGLAELSVEGAIDQVVQAAAAAVAEDGGLASALDLPSAAAEGGCWRLTRMDERNCVVATPCVGRGATADVAALGATDESIAAFRGPRRVPLGGDVRLCHPIMQRMHALKDPKQQNLAFNYPFANFLSQNRSSANVTYGAANCHGTAQALAGGFLAKLPVTGLTFHSAWIEERCGGRAKAAYEASGAAPTGDHLPIDRGGYVVNMVHDSACSPDACGKVSFHTFDCSAASGPESLESHVFVQDMCIHCWDRLLREAGRARLPKTATWRDLKAGCVMTASDHSITLVLQNDGLCYYYESLSPFAPPQVGVDDCPGLFRRFPARWCPAEPLRLSLSQGG